MNNLYSLKAEIDENKLRIGPVIIIIVSFPLPDES